MALPAFIVPLAIAGLSLLLRSLFGETFPLRWWLLRLGLLPLIFFVFASYILLSPTPLPPDYDPDVHGNPGRMDFIAAMFWGAAAPFAYLVIALPVSIGYAIWRKRRLAPKLN